LNKAEFLPAKYRTPDFFRWKAEITSLFLKKKVGEE